MSDELSVVHKDKKHGLPVIIIPAYQPDRSLLQLVQSISVVKSGEIIVVDDGSDESCTALFSEISLIPNVRVLRHAVNLGKGQALKTAFNDFLLHSAVQSPGVITADADGQHCVEDIMKLMNAFAKHNNKLFMGAREFQGEVPLRSKFGNGMTRKVFSLFVGKSLKDTQTGLRGIPRALIANMLTVPAMGYEFELEMLIKAGQEHVEIEEISIETIYEDGNKCSHFNPLIDSLKIYFVFLRFSAVSLLTALLDFVVFIIVYLLFPSILLSTCLSRIVAGVFNFTCGKLLVFKSRGDISLEAIKYALLVLVLMMVSYGLVLALVNIFGLNVYVSKVIAEGSLFIASFAIQRIFVFGKGYEK